MKKNLFLLFSFYFFVLQSIFAGLLRSEPKFYWLALINFVFLMVIVFLTKEDTKKVDLDEPAKIEHKSIMSKGKTGNLFVWLLFLVLILIIVWVGLRYLNSDSMSGVDTHVQYTGQNFQDTDVNLESGIIMTNTGVDVEVFSGGDVVDTGNVFVQDNDGDNSEIVDFPGESVDLTKLATIDDVVKYLLKGENLSTSTNLSFRNISKNSDSYPYYRTAYDKKMLGTDVNPNKNILCETYLVMKGLVEGWSVGNYVNIKDAYWNFAEKNGKLPICKKGKYVKLGDILQ